MTWLVSGALIVIGICVGFMAFVATKGIVRSEREMRPHKYRTPGYNMFTGEWSDEKEGSTWDPPYRRRREPEPPSGDVPGN